jgi:hypothetical protein
MGQKFAPDEFGQDTMKQKLKLSSLDAGKWAGPQKSVE